MSEFDKEQRQQRALQQMEQTIRDPAEVERLRERYQWGLLQDAGTQQLINHLSAMTGVSPAQIGRVSTLDRQELEDYLARTRDPGSALEAEEDQARRMEVLEERFKQRKAEQAQKARRKQTSAGTKRPKLTEGQEKARVTAVKGKLAGEQYQAALDKGWDPTSYWTYLDHVDMAPQFIKTDDGIQAKAAERSWTETFLREVSGAAIGVNERSNYAADFFPRPGDPPEVVQNKRELRKVQEKMASEKGWIAPGEKLNEFGVPVPSAEAKTDDATSGDGAFEENNDFFDRILNRNQPSAPDVSTLTPEQRRARIEELRAKRGN